MSLKFEYILLAHCFQIPLVYVVLSDLEEIFINHTSTSSKMITCIFCKVNDALTFAELQNSNFLNLYSQFHNGDHYFLLLLLPSTIFGGVLAVVKM
jgi:hypothetical protein